MNTYLHIAGGAFPLLVLAVAFLVWAYKNRYGDFLEAKAETRTLERHLEEMTQRRDNWRDRTYQLVGAVAQQRAFPPPEPIVPAPFTEAPALPF